MDAFRLVFVLGLLLVGLFVGSFSACVLVGFEGVCVFCC